MSATLQKIKDDMSATNAEIERLKEEANERGKVAFSAACKELFAMHPSLEAIRWNQYTPYFCDGDPCEFGVNDVYIKLHGDDDGGDYEDGFLDGYQCSEEVQKILLDCCAVHGMLTSDTFLALFGDHVEVTVTADGVDTSEYEHD